MSSGPSLRYLEERKKSEMCVVYLRAESWCGWYLSPEHHMDPTESLLEVFRKEFENFDDDFQADGKLTLSVCLGNAEVQQDWDLFKQMAQQLLEQVRQDPLLSPRFTIKPAGCFLIGPNMHAAFRTEKVL